MDEIDKYVLEQAKIEIDHTRSWPTKILAFFLAINVAIVTAVRFEEGTSCPIKLIISAAILLLLYWAFYLLMKNHLSYLRYRRMQVQFQKAHRKEMEVKFSVPDEWFEDIEVCLGTRWQGWAFYFFLVILVTLFGLAGTWSV